MLLNSLLAAGSILLIVQIVMLWRFTHVTGTIRRHEARLGHLCDTMTLLTETTESGFRAVAMEIDRLATPAAPRPAPRPTATRIATAARRGRSVQQIAAEEQVSEGEVRLRLHMNEQARAKANAARTTKAARGANAPQPSTPAHASSSMSTKDRSHGDLFAD